MTVLLIALYPLARASGMSDASYTTLFQTSSRWNGFVALAIAEKLTGDSGMVLVALVLALIVIPLNFINVIMLVWYGTGGQHGGPWPGGSARNPVHSRLCRGYRGQCAVHRSSIRRSNTRSTSSRVHRWVLGMLLVGAGTETVTDALRPGPAVLTPCCSRADRVSHCHGGGRRPGSGLWRRNGSDPGPVRSRKLDGDERLSSRPPDGRRRSTLRSRDHGGRPRPPS